MGKRFVPVRDADKRALELYFMLSEVAQLSLIGIKVRKDAKKPIVVWDKNEPDKWWDFSVDGFLQLSVEQTKANGGTAFALMMSRRQPTRPKIPQAEVDRAVDKFFADEDDE
jgi:hypothetical protein